jgi:hypothetical protein
MIADKRSWQFVDQFTDQWLDVGALQRVAVTPDYYPKFDNLSINGDVSAVPEPSSALLAGFGLLAIIRRRRS